MPRAAPVAPSLPPDLAALLSEKGKTFAFAARFLFDDRRAATIVLYAWFRRLDDLVDEPGPGLTDAVRRDRLIAWRGWLAGGPAPAGEEPLAAAGDLGIAMQLTNILRDIGGDLARDRVYLPALPAGTCQPPRHPAGFSRVEL